ncbi:MAG: sigma-70 family RNA polymerase sigma factor [Phycisphaerae bacterium]
MKILEDRSLIRRFKAGDLEALRRIYEKYKDSLLKLSVVLTNDVNTAQDSVHEVFLSFAKSIGKIKPRGNLKGYLFASVINQIRNTKRDSARHKLTELNDTDCAVSDMPRPEQWAILSEQLKLLSIAMAQLPDEQREAVAMRIEGDMAFKEIAAIQEVSANTVKGRYRYGIDKLRSILDGKV